MLTDAERTKDKSPEYMQAWKEGLREIEKIIVEAKKHKTKPEINQALAKIKAQAKEIPQPKPPYDNPNESPGGTRSSKRKKTQC